MRASPRGGTTPPGRRLFLPALALAWVGLGSPLGAQAPAEGQVDAAVRRLRDALESAVGHAWSVVGPGGVASGAVGAVAPDGRPLQPTDLFRVYSVAKPMTATALARLVERGAAAPDQDVSLLVPAFRPPEGAVTLMQLATHRGGVRHYRDEAEALGVQPCASLDDALATFTADSLVAAPGAGEHYSSWGFVLLSAAIAAAADASFPAAMAELVFDPARMVGIRMPLSDEAGAPSGGAWIRDGSGTLRPEGRQDLSCKFGAGGFLASPVDLARFGRALVDGTLLSQPMMDLFFRGDPTFEAQGLGPGGAAFLIVDRPSGWAVALVSNTSGPAVDGQLRTVALQALAALTGAPPGSSPTPAGQTARHLTGRF